MTFLVMIFLLWTEATPTRTPVGAISEFDWTPVGFAFGGGLAIKLLDLLERNNIPLERRPTLSALYWAAFVILPLIGAFIALAYVFGEQALNPLLAIQIGASAPLIIKSLAAAVPK